MEKNENIYKPLLWSDKHILFASSMRGGSVRIVSSFILSHHFCLYLRINQDFFPLHFYEMSSQCSCKLAVCLKLFVILSLPQT